MAAYVAYINHMYSSSNVYFMTEVWTRQIINGGKYGSNGVRDLLVKDFNGTLPSNLTILGFMSSSYSQEFLIVANLKEKTLTRYDSVHHDMDRDTESYVAKLSIFAREVCRWDGQLEKSVICDPCQSRASDSGYFVLKKVSLLAKGDTTTVTPDMLAGFKAELWKLFTDWLCGAA